MQQLKAAYSNYWWARLAACVGLFICGSLLYCFSGGFPPWAWSFASTVLPQIPRLWQQQGPIILLPLLGLGLLSLSILILWLVLLSAITRIVWHWWQSIASQQRFAQELQEAEYLAERMAEREREEAERRPSEIATQLSQKIAARRAAAGMLSVVSGPPSERRYGLQSAPASPIPTSSLWSSRYASAPAASLPVARVPSSLISPASASQSRPQAEQRVLSVPLSPPPAVHSQLRVVQQVEEAEDEHCDTLPYLELESEQDIEEEPTLPNTDALDEDEEQEGMLRLVVGIGLDPGIVRKNAPNEDNLLATQGMRAGKDGAEPVGLFVVADGMGGHAHGQEASRLAIQTISDVISASLLRAVDEDETFSDLLKDGAHRANLAIYRRNRQQERMMGTTLTAALVVGTTAYIVNVGDSRTYLYRPSGGLTQITRDHSLVARMAESGVISHEDIYTHPQRNQIYRCLGDQASLELDSFEVMLQAGDLLVLCSDGLWEMVRDPDIQRIIAASAPHASHISSMLIQSALTNGGVDNISVVVVCLVRGKE